MKKDVIFILAFISIVTVFSFQNCGQSSGHIEQEELGQITFVDTGCLQGRMCLDENDKDCVNDIGWYQFDEKTVCPKDQ